MGSNPIIWKGTIHGEPASKANSRRLVMFGVRPASIKSKKALDYAVAAWAQLPVLDPLFKENVSIEIDIYYASRRPDLDESLILDVMQKRIYNNDRQVRTKHIYWHLDRANPRAEIVLRAWEGRQ